MVDLNIFLHNIKSKLVLDKSDIYQGFEIFCGYIKDDFDRLIILIHLLMLQSNFQHTNDTIGDTNNPYVKLETGKSYAKLIYNQVQSGHTITQLESNLIITFIRSGARHADFNLKCGTFNSSFLQIDFESMKKQMDSDKKIASLANDFKDTIFNPFKHYFKQVKLINGLTDLPVELIYKIAVSYLNIRSVLSLMQTSKYLYNILNSDQTSSNSLWFLLFKRDWVTIYTSSNKDWLQSNAINFRTDYIKNYKALKRDTNKFVFPDRLYRNFN